MKPPPERREHVAAETRFGLRAVEEYLRNARLAPEERLEIVRDFLLDARVQAAWPHAGMQYIPDRDARCPKSANPCLIGRRRIDSNAR